MIFCFYVDSKNNFCLLLKKNSKKNNDKLTNKKYAIIFFVKLYINAIKHVIHIIKVITISQRNYLHYLRGFIYVTCLIK